MSVYTSRCIIVSTSCSPYECSNWILISQKDTPSPLESESLHAAQSTN